MFQKATQVTCEVKIKFEIPVPFVEVLFFDLDPKGSDDKPKENHAPALPSSV